MSNRFKKAAAVQRSGVPQVDLETLKPANSIRQPESPSVAVPAPASAAETKSAKQGKASSKVLDPASIVKVPKPEATVEEHTRPYSTYLKPSQVKGIKLRAIEDDVNDQEIVQAAVDEYFAKHPL